MRAHLYKPTAIGFPAEEPLELQWLRSAANKRRKHKKRVARALKRYLESLDPCGMRRTASESPLIELMRAQEASRGSRIRARNAEARWLAVRAPSSEADAEEGE